MRWNALCVRYKVNTFQRLSLISTIDVLGNFVYSTTFPVSQPSTACMGLPPPDLRTALFPITLWVSYLWGSSRLMAAICIAIQGP